MTINWFKLGLVLVFCLGVTVVLGLGSTSAQNDPVLKRKLQSAHRLQVVGRYGDAVELYKKLYQLQFRDGDTAVKK